MGLQNDPTTYRKSKKPHNITLRAKSTLGTLDREPSKTNRRQERS